MLINREEQPKVSELKWHAAMCVVRTGCSQCVSHICIMTL